MPSGLAVEVNGSTIGMRGSDHVPIRCAALSGQVGKNVACGIHEWRPSTCGEFAKGSDDCSRARRKHDMAPLDEIGV